jgi:hypothetical protein
MATKKQVSISLSAPTLTPKVRIALVVAAGLLGVLISFNVGHNAGFKKGHTAGFAEGNSAGDKAGFERGYWDGAEYGCNFVFDEVKTTYVIGAQNPFSYLYALMGLGNVSLTRDNCSTDGHGKAPYSGGPTDSN